MGSDPVYLHNYLHLAGISIFYYDFTLTFSDEYWRIWKQRKHAGSYLFFLNRYLTFLGDIAVNVGNFSHFKSDLSCEHYSFYRQVLLIVAQVVVCVLSFLRTYALYRRSKWIAAFILTMGLSLLGLSCWAVIGQKDTVDLNGGCHTGLDRITAIRTAVAWESLFVFDLMIFFLTMYKTWDNRVTRPLVRASGKLDLLSLIFRDGAMYFAVMAVANLANTLTFYFLQPLLRGVLSTFASSVSVAMMSRLMLNLHEGATGTGILTGTTAATAASASDNSTTLLFTSQITFGHDAQAPDPYERDHDIDPPEEIEYELRDMGARRRYDEDV
ncbi:hypothetical protein CERSUDRAFT_116996 [Gelatoporia subvermispora B]|uniref:DUF6533 domain-containing protein n=1 Tax=Ceriporiopsis subvermispora (strain B) TaxID=914234 RepID=M2PFU4_CERS8|nr:hypothetical protein CERSUDRAFT_116996 [Gelatoporia subvermispora B]